jgi:hypothetical protein
MRIAVFDQAMDREAGRSEALEARVAELLLRRHFGPARLARYESEDGERKEGELGLWYRSMIP